MIAQEMKDVCVIIQGIIPLGDAVPSHRRRRFLEVPKHLLKEGPGGPVNSPH